MDEVALSTVQNILAGLNDAERNSLICKITDEQRSRYAELLKAFKEANGRSGATDAEKGRVLEELVSYLLEISGDLFTVMRNIRTSTNELDILVGLKAKGRLLLNLGFLVPPLSSFIGECKNYATSVSVTYVGKFCSLMLTSNCKFGVMFSYHGVSGKGWKDGSGLIRKFYLHREHEADRYAIIDFGLAEFERVLNGEGFLAILNSQIQALKYDTSYEHFLDKHPAEDSCPDVEALANAGV